MKIVIIGSGNVAAILGRKFRAAGHQIVQVYSRNAAAASELAYEWGIDSTNYISLINREASIYLIAVDDQAIASIAAELKLTGKIVVHTAAAVPKQILATVSENYGVFYPLQSLRKEMEGLPAIPIFYDGSNEDTIDSLAQLARSISGEAIKEINDDDRIKIHVAAVVVSNFVNHLYKLAEDYCVTEGIAFNQLLPLIEETALRIRNIDPKNSQTGPAIRNDNATIYQHLEHLKNHPHLKHIYEVMTASIQQQG